jgi:nucleoside 2-deoxyribosyltransferase
VPTCFVIMPISTPPGLVNSYLGDSQHFQHVFDVLHAPAARQAGFDVIAPVVASSEVIPGEIIRNLSRADLVVCDISTHNPNVFFELGIRVALDRPVAMVKDDQTSTIPFDNAMVGCHTYGSRLDTWRIQDEINELADWIRNAGAQQRNAVWRHFGVIELANAEFHAAVKRLLEQTGLSTRKQMYRTSRDPERRAVTLIFVTLPSAFVQSGLRDEAAKLGLTLHLRSEDRA